MANPNNFTFDQLAEMGNYLVEDIFTLYHEVQAAKKIASNDGILAAILEKLGTEIAAHLDEDDMEFLELENDLQSIGVSAQ